MTTIITLDGEENGYDGFEEEGNYAPAYGDGDQCGNGRGGGRGNTEHAGASGYGVGCGLTMMDVEYFCADPSTGFGDGLRYGDMGGGGF